MSNASWQYAAVVPIVAIALVWLALRLLPQAVIDGVRRFAGWPAPSRKGTCGGCSGCCGGSRSSDE